MKTIIIIISSMFLISCTAVWKPIVDARVSKEPREITRDLLECKELTKDIKGHGAFCQPETLFASCKPANEPIRKCLINRGHSVLN
tara:strand:- start:674 stop:931 length:258 start_codon:yes stop_codon:yes gene_type:complete